MIDNAKEEFLNEIKGKKLICARVHIPWCEYVLPENYSEEQFEKFCDGIDYEYFNSLGEDKLKVEGLLLFNDGSYSVRHYSPYECWKNIKVPQVEDVMLGNISHWN